MLIMLIMMMMMMMRIMWRSNRIAPPPPTALQLVLVVLMITGSANPAASTRRRDPPIALPGCSDSCGNISIPYPFGIEPNCFLNPWYRVLCNSTYDTPKPFLPSLTWKYTLFFPNRPVQIVSIDTTPISIQSSANPLLSLVVLGPRFGIPEAYRLINLTEYYKHLDMRGSPFRLMPLLNTLVVIGCGGSGILRNIKNQSVVGCTTVCPDNTSAKKLEGHMWSSTKPLFQVLGNSTDCYGIGCCQAAVPSSLDYFNFEFQTFELQGSINSNISNGISIVLITLVETSYLENMTSASHNWSALDFFEGATTRLQWKLQDLPSNVPNRTSASCIDTQEGGYYCRCNLYYQGNPYLPQGCQVVQGCEECPDNCVSLHGGNAKYGCLWPDVYHRKSAVPIALGLGISFGTISLFVIFYGLFRFLKVKKEIRQKRSNFKKNGGLLLQQQMSGKEGGLERTKVFTCNELERATDNFNENRILGQGGQGTVYKGMLLDGTIVAIKKSKRVDESQLGQFINEVVILSQIVHRNVVKLFGCCLETEVPLLVYEFVHNGTLFQHIHNPREDFPISWKLRLQIAIELAEALTYLHSSSFLPIYHRDIKTSNILLDDRYRAKLADFGISKTVSIDQTHVTTCIQGTFGYIDPEYFQSNQFTEKSDVYSFGVVLLELLSSKKPVYMDKSTDTRSLPSEFLLCMQQCRLCDIIDVDVLKVTDMKELEGVADLAKKCLNLNGNKRPTMKEVAMTLQMIKSKKGVPHPSSEQIYIGKDQVCLIDEGPSSSSIPPLSISSDDSSLYTHPLLFDTNSRM